MLNFQEKTCMAECIPGGHLYMASYNRAKQSANVSGDQRMFIYSTSICRNLTGALLMAKGKMKSNYASFTEGTLFQLKEKQKAGGHVHRKHK